MEIIILSKNMMLSLRRLTSLEKFNIISIIDPDCEFLFEEPLKPNIIQLKFSDIEGNEPEGCIGSENWILFNEDHGKKIIEFLDNMDMSKDLVVHCSAGISRSGAVGDFARVKFGIPYEGQFARVNYRIQPNAWISKVLRELHMKGK